eukprot:PLAT1777.3.p2 GENE.PLAT1777.3~~PLAT1777.3.p2  ORF type:complete len:281 (-),score=144.15 PLAT1777.3:71-913(-)
MPLGEHAANFIAGGAAGASVDFVLFPLDTIKTRLQARGASVKPSGSFYKGLASAMAGSFPAAATFWWSYETSKAMLTEALGDSHPALLPVTHMASATVAEVATCLVRNPFEVVKQQMQVGMHGSGTMAAVRTIMAKEGISGLYAGYMTTIAREIPFDMLQFTLYEAFKARMIESKGGEDLVLWENSMVGSLAGGISAAVTTPLDVVKTRLMTQGGLPEAERYAGFRDAMRRIAAEEGVATLFSGITPRVMWISLGGAIFFGVFEELRRRLRGDGEEEEVE